MDRGRRADARADRPYVGSTTDNSALSLALGYNGLGRVDGQTGGTSIGGGGGRCVLGDTRLVPADQQRARRSGRLVAAARDRRRSVAFVAALLAAPPARLGALAVIGGWFVAAAVVFCFSSGIIHTYYLSALAPATAALVGIGAVALWRDARPAEGGSRFRSLALVPAAGWRSSCSGARGTLVAAGGRDVAGVGERGHRRARGPRRRRGGRHRAGWWPAGDRGGGGRACSSAGRVVEDAARGGRERGLPRCPGRATSPGSDAAPGRPRGVRLRRPGQGFGARAVGSARRRARRVAGSAGAGRAASAATPATPRRRWSTPRQTGEQRAVAR